MLVHQLTSIVFNNTDTILISSLCGLASASVYTIYMLFFSNIEKLFYSIVNSISFRLGQLFYVEPESSNGCTGCTMPFTFPRPLHCSRPWLCS